MDLRESAEMVRRLYVRLLDAQEEERARIAQGIHDDSIQVVTAVGLRLETLRRGLADPTSIEQIERLQATVESAIKRLRTLLFDLRPRALDEEGLAAALRLYLDQIERESVLLCSVDNRLIEEPHLEVRTVLFRIAQEAIVNVRKHANATQVQLLIEPRDKGFHVRVSDDGEGFDEGDAFGRDELEIRIPVEVGVGSCHLCHRSSVRGSYIRSRSRLDTSVYFRPSHDSEGRVQ